MRWFATTAPRQSTRPEREPRAPAQSARARLSSGGWRAATPNAQRAKFAPTAPRRINGVTQSETARAKQCAGCAAGRRPDRANVLSCAPGSGPRAIPVTRLPRQRVPHRRSCRFEADHIFYPRRPSQPHHGLAHERPASLSPRNAPVIGRALVRRTAPTKSEDAAGSPPPHPAAAKGQRSAARPARPKMRRAAPEKSPQAAPGWIRASGGRRGTSRSRFPAKPAPKTSGRPSHPPDPRPKRASPADPDAVPQPSFPRRPGDRHIPHPAKWQKSTPARASGRPSCVSEVDRSTPSHNKGIKTSLYRD